MSDLHLAAGRDDGFGLDGSFSRFLDALRRRADDEDRPLRLVFLGDLLDFPRVDGGGRGDAGERALAKLERMAARHRSVFDALRRFLAHGLPVDVVVGNHDVDLVRPQVRTALAETVGAGAGADRPSLTFHPWQFHVPGLVYAEHGHQYHDINAFSTVLRPCGAGGSTAVETTLGSAVDDHVHARGPARHATLAGALARRGLQALDPGRPVRRRAYRRHVLPAHAAAVGLSPAALVRLDQLSARTARAMPTRMAAKAVASMAHRPTSKSGDYLLRAASSVAHILDVEGAGVPFYVFGHTHHAGRWPLAGGSRPAEYLNTGTWSSMGGRSDGRPTFVEITVSEAGPAAHPRCWDDDGR